MTHAWPKAKLGDLLRSTGREEAVDRSATYRLLGVRLDGEGPFLREEKSGAAISATKLSRVRTDDFVYSRLFAWRGAFGVISRELDGCHVSGEFPTFTAVPGRLDVGFLRHWFRLPDTLRAVEVGCSGSTPLTRNRFKEERLLDLEIPLPPLAAQCRIVAQLGELAAEIHVARTLRRQAVAEAEALTASLLTFLLPRNVEMKPLGELVSPSSKISYGVLVPGPEVKDGVPFVRVQDLDLNSPAPQPNKRIAREVDAKYERTRLKGGEILIGVVGSIGKVGIAPRSWSGANIARAVCRIVPGEAVERDYLALVLSAQPTQAYFRNATRTLAQPTLNVAQLAQTPVPVPPLQEQRRIVSELGALQAEMDTLKRRQAGTAAELDALMPSILDKAFRGEL